MRRALDDFVVLGTTTNLRFLRELCDHEDVVSGNTDTTMIETVWPNGWSPQFSSDTLNAALMVAGVSESAGLHRLQSTTTPSDDGPQSPFQSLTRRYP
jgi:acetyl/propionyl-CoA carboxylase alpha subunit